MAKAKAARGARASTRASTRKTAAERQAARAGTDPNVGQGEQGMNRARRAAQSGAAADQGADTTLAELEALDAGSTSDMTHLERKRQERGSQIRGTGDMAPPVHGATRPVETSATDGADVATLAEDYEARVKARPKGIRVEATKIGYYDDKRRRTGDVFTIDGTLDNRKDIEVIGVDGQILRTIKNPKYGKVAAFSDKWMKPVDPGTRERLTTGQQDLERLRRETNAERGKAKALAHEADNPLGG